jgi:hypothetical protein
MTVKEISEAAELTGAAQALVREDSTPSTYLDSLEKAEQPLYEDAIRFLAFQLEVVNGVKWACACVRELQSPEAAQRKNETLDASEQWTRTPTDEARWAAKNVSRKSQARGSSKLIAMAVFFSGGSIAGAGAPETPPPKNLAQKMVAGAVQGAINSYMVEKAEERRKRALEIGRKIGGGSI